MQSIDFKRFMFEQKIKQKELAEYLGLSKSYISLVISGDRPLSEENLRKLIDNPYGWDTSILRGESKETTQPENPMADEPKQDSLVEYLKSEIKNLQSMISQLNEEKADLLRENAVLEYQIMMYAPKGERTAENADGSLSADAV